MFELNLFSIAAVVSVVLITISILSALYSPARARSSMGIMTNDTESEDYSINNRHKSAYFIAKLANIFGWVLIISIIGIPIGISLLLFGHMTLAAIETEYNSRENSHVLKQILKELKKSTPVRNIHK